MVEKADRVAQKSPPNSAQEFESRMSTTRIASIYSLGGSII